MKKSDSDLPASYRTRFASETEEISHHSSLGLLVWLSELRRRHSLDRSLPLADAEDCFASIEFGRFLLTRFLGSGSYGAVFLAEDRQLEREVAVKIAWPSVMMDPECSQRFIDEPKTVASLSHPGIIQVHDSGCIELAHFIAFEFIDGPTLAEWRTAQEQIHLRTAAMVVADVASALHFGHERGVIHRDLKPSNVLLRPKKDADASFPYQPVVTDFGLASRGTDAERSEATATNAVLGTDRYMSPEQAAGSSRDAGAETDVFSLGVILFELVTGVRPFEGESGENVREQIRNGDPLPVRSLRRGVPKDLETIILKCLEKAPERRYRSAAELEDDLRRYLAGQAVCARPMSVWRRGWKAVKRHPQVTGLVVGAVFIGLVVAALVGAFIEERRSSQARIALAVRSQETAEAREREFAYATSVRFAARSFQRGNRGETSGYLAEAKSIAESGGRVGLAWQLLSLMNEDVQHILPANFGSIRGLRFSPDSSLLISGGSDNRLMFWSTSTWKPLRTVLNPGRAIECVEFSPDGLLLAIGGENGRVVVLSVDGERTVFNEKLFDGEVFSICWVGDSRRVAAGGRDGVVGLIDIGTGHFRTSAPIEPSPKATALDPDHPNEVSSIAFIPSRDCLAVLKAPPEIVLLDTADLSEINRWEESAGDPAGGSMCLIVHGREYLVTVGADLMSLYDVDVGSRCTTGTLGQMIQTVRFSPESSQLIGCFRDGSVQVWDVKDITQGVFAARFRFPGHRGRSLSCDLSSDGQWLASGGKDMAVRIRARPSNGCSFETPMKNRPINAQFSPSGRWLALAEGREDGSGFVSVFQVADGRLVWQLAQPPSYTEALPFDSSLPYWEVAFARDEETVVIREPDGGVSRRECATGKILKRLPISGVEQQVLLFSPSDQWLIANGIPNTRVFDVETGELVTKLDESSSVVGSYVTSTGPIWVKSNVRGSCRIQRELDGTPFRSVGRSDDPIHTTALSPDGRYLAAVGGHPLIYVLDLRNPSRIIRLMASDRVLGLSFANDSQTLLSLHREGSVHCWHVPTGSELLTIGSAADQILCMAVHPRDNMVVFGVKHEGGTFGLRTYRFVADGHSQHFEFKLANRHDDLRP